MSEHHDLQERHEQPDLRSLSMPSRATTEKTDKPFLIEHLRLDPAGNAAGTTDVHFVPAARLLVTDTLRTGGLLRVLPDAEAKSLLLLLTFLRPNGRCEASAVEVAAALAVSPAKARARMERLASLRWQEMPIVRAIPNEREELDKYVLAPSVTDERINEPQNEPQDVRRPSGVPAPPAHSYRDAIIAHSREQYTHPRAEVERQIAEQLGYAPVQVETEPGPIGDARRNMAAIGVSREQIDYLLDTFPLEEIEKQIAWLPHRHARKPAKLLVAAITGSYEPPAFIRLQQALAADDPFEDRPGEAEGSTLPGISDVVLYDSRQRDENSNGDD